MFCFYLIFKKKKKKSTQSAHPGRVMQIGENPQDSNKLLVGYSSGLIALWDLRTRVAEARFKYGDVNYLFFCFYYFLMIIYSI